VVFSNFFCRFTPLRTRNPGPRFWGFLRIRWFENPFLGQLLCWGLKEVIRGNSGRKTRSVHLELAKHLHFREFGPKMSKIGHFWQNKGWTCRFLPIFESDPKMSIFCSLYKRKKSVSRVIWVPKNDLAAQISPRSFRFGQMGEKWSKMDPSIWREWSIVAAIWHAGSKNCTQFGLEGHFFLAKVVKFWPNRQKVVKMSFLDLILDRESRVPNEPLLSHFCAILCVKTVYLAPNSPRNTFLPTSGSQKIFSKITDFGQILKGLTHDFGVDIFGFFDQNLPKSPKWGSRLGDHKSTNAPKRKCLWSNLAV